MTKDPNVDPPTAVSVGDGTLGGAAVGGSVTGPNAGEIHDPVGADVAVPIESTPDEPPAPEDVTDDPRGEAEAASAR